MRCDPSLISVLFAIVLFQSLLGFLMRCDFRLTNESMKAGTMFQSLLGFLMRCDMYSDPSSYSCMFQSLLGFLMRCDISIAICVIRSCVVSIPAGFSDALRPDDAERKARQAKRVSIPAGFSDALRLP